MSNTVNNKRIARNTLALYIRMLVLMVVSFYTTRVTLQILGVEDFGVYNLIAGIVALFQFVYSVLETSIQRFLNYEIGKNDKEKVNNVFCTSITIMLILCVIVFVIGELVGWAILPQLQIPEERRNVASIVYHISIIQFCLGLMRCPYNSIIIAYERMNFYAYLSILEALLRLLVVFLLCVIPFDKLIFYSFSQCSVLLLVLVCYRFYCNRTFDTTKFRIPNNRDTFKSLLSFSGWSLFGSVANLSVTQGTNIILNLFGGVIITAATGIASQFSAAINLFVTNFQVAFRPQVVKLYSAQKYNELNELIIRATKITSFLFLILVIPLFFLIPKILHIWLGDYPQYTSRFCELKILMLLVSSLQAPLWMYVQASGRIRTYQIVVSLINIINLPLGFLVLWLGYDYSSIFIVEIIIYIIMYIFRVLYVKLSYKFPISSYLKETLLPIIVIFMVSIFVTYFTYLHTTGIVQILLTLIVGIIVCLLMIWNIGLSLSEKTMIKNYITNQIKH